MTRNLKRSIAVVSTAFQTGSGNMARSSSNAPTNGFFRLLNCSRMAGLEKKPGKE